MGRKKMVTVAASVPAWAKMRLEALAKKKKMSVRKLAGEILVKALVALTGAPEEPGLEETWAMVRKTRLEQQIAVYLRGQVPPPSQQDEVIRSFLREIRELEKGGVPVEDLKEMMEALIAKFVLVNPIVYGSEPGHFLLVRGPGGEAMAKALLKTGKLVFVKWSGLRAWVMSKLLATTYPFEMTMGPEEAAMTVEERAKRMGLKVSVVPAGEGTAPGHTPPRAG